MNITMIFFQHIGAHVLSFLASIGRVTIFFKQAVIKGMMPPFYFKQIGCQLMQIGYNSLPLVGLTAIFSGMVLALQSYTGFSRFSAEGSIATVVVLSMTRELGPVLAGLMVAGRVGASIAAEIGTMRVTEQIDALEILSTNPFQYLVFPRVFAGVIMLPLLVLVADVIGVFGGYIVSTYVLNFNSGNYVHQTLRYLQWEDVNSGLIKAAVFGGVITLMGCYHGFYSSRGAEGVGRATTNAVVSSSILIFLLNYVLTSALFER
jgi:phospholipid/cholesterol/gamma-HCH transport system permease protein